MNLEVGSQIGDYQVVGILGAGGMGQVYKVRNVISDRVEAMKVLLPDLMNEPELADRFLREIKVQASLEHPNIAGLHTAVRVENQLLMLMELLEGVTLEQKLKAGPLPVREAVNYIRQTLEALEYAHGRGVIHRDIKPANMMLTPQGMVKLMDFGIAKAASDRKLTMTGMTMGSLYYMSPEQIQGSTSLDARADLYSVGVTLYELVTGKRPFDGDSQYAIMAAHLEKTPVPPIQIDSRLPQVLNDAILMSVAKDPNARFQTAAAFRNALGSIAAAAAVTVTKPKKAESSDAAGGQRSRRGMWMAIGAVAATLAVIALIEFGPRKGTKAAPDLPALQTPTQTSTPPVQTPPPTAGGPGAPPIGQGPVVSQPPMTQSPPAAPPKVRPAPPTVQGSAQQQPVQQPTVVQQPPSQASQPTPQVQSQAPPDAPPVRQAPPAQPQVDAAARAALQQIREELMLLNNRANTVRNSLANLQRAQAAQGLGTSSRFLDPAGRMDNYLQGARDALSHNDPETARSFMQKAERAVEELEKLLGSR